MEIIDNTLGASNGVHPAIQAIRDPHEAGRRADFQKAVMAQVEAIDTAQKFNVPDYGTAAAEWLRLHGGVALAPFLK